VRARRIVFEQVYHQPENEAERETDDKNVRELPSSVWDIFYH
jgi:hypothetical protein